MLECFEHFYSEQHGCMLECFEYFYSDQHEQHGCMLECFEHFYSKKHGCMLEYFEHFFKSNTVVCLSVLNIFIACNMGVYSADGAYILNGCFPTGVENFQTRFTPLI